ncbi:hypothetical protein M569_12304 [Genlisea aurea]|uniref:Protein-ribulosamine 3-kinase n=1 Tax=Genlisea aurea TaxID=192259 RepID=S8CDF1_9LAMI|nr:hypothetical protein M569_12304 [Genlisea aurea]
MVAVGLELVSLSSASVSRSLYHRCIKSVSFTVTSMSVDPIRDWILSEGKATQITGIRPIGGGCINRANRYDTDVGSFFVKTNRNSG